jgi:uncharacterized protein YciI
MIKEKKLMLFAIYMLDKANSQQLRADTGKEHAAYMAANEGGMRMGGPLCADDNKTMIGSVVIKEFIDREAAEKFIANEPYNKAGLFEMVLINPFRAFVNN